MKNQSLNRWFWKWHIVAGLISLPVFLLLSVTGALYLFKDKYEAKVYQNTFTVAAEGTPASFEEQLLIARSASVKPINKLVIPREKNQATQFVSGKRGGKQSVYVDPYRRVETGKLATKETDMYTVRKLHGELLLGLPGTLVVELVGSWLIVLVITGLYVWWPGKRFAKAGFFTIRLNKGRRIFFRDLHAVIGFWTSLVLLLILAGGMPWSEVFGAQYRRVQELAQSGYPSTWMSPRSIESNIRGEPMNLDQMVAVAKIRELDGDVSVAIPRSPKGVFTVSNRSLYLKDQWVGHFDQYSGVLLNEHSWSDVGAMMSTRQFLMRIHQGEYGFFNWIVVLLACVGFTIATAAGLASYLLRKRKGKWSLPTTPANFQVGWVLAAMIVTLGFVFPLFGGSLLLLWVVEKVREAQKRGSTRLAT